MMQRILVLIISLLVTACSEQVPTMTPLPDNAVILAFGDSLTYGSGVDSDTESYPVTLQRLSGRRVINAGKPGEVSQEGVTRLEHLLETLQPDLVIVCHGGNDILRRVNKTALKSNIEKMLGSIKNSGAQAVLVGVPAFEFGLSVPALYEQLAEQFQIPIEKDALVELQKNSMLKSDQVHLNAQGYAILGQHIYQLLQQANAL